MPTLLTTILSFCFQKKNLRISLDANFGLVQLGRPTSYTDSQLGHKFFIPQEKVDEFVNSYSADLEKPNSVSNI